MITYKLELLNFLGESISIFRLFKLSKWDLMYNINFTLDVNRIEI